MRRGKGQRHPHRVALSSWQVSKRTEQVKGAPLASVRVRTESGAESTLHAGDIVGRISTAALLVDDPRVSEAHALVSLRRGRFVLLALRRLIVVACRPVRDVELRRGVRIELAPGRGFEVLDVRIPDQVLAVTARGLGVRRLGPVVSLFGGASPRVVGQYRSDAPCHVWSLGEQWRLRMNEVTQSVKAGDSVAVQGTNFSFVSTDLRKDAPESTQCPEGCFGALKLVTFFDGAEIHRAGHPILTVGGVGARILTELAALDGPAHWQLVAGEVWDDADQRDPMELRQRWDTAVLRLRKKLQGADVRADLLRADGNGYFQLGARPGGPSRGSIVTTTFRSSAGWSDSPEDDSDTNGSSDGTDNDRWRTTGGSPSSSEDRYEWQDIVGVGGMGTVHVAHDRRLDRQVALKEMHRVPLNAERSLLAWEAWIVARLEHPAIVPVYDSGTDSDGRQFFTMRLVRGDALSDVLSQTSSLDDRLRLLRPFLQVCEAIAYAHSRGVVHRDLKPANIMIGQFGEVQVVDWGLAAYLDAVPCAVADPGLRKVGTGRYASPEQHRGDAPDPRADVFSLGMMLSDLLDSHGGAPEALCAIAAKATASRPDHRYRTAVELADDVQRFVDGRAVRAHAYTTWQTVGRIARANRGRLVLTAVAIAAALSTFALSYTRLLQERARALKAEAHARAAASAARAAEGEVTRSLIEAESSLAWALEAQAATALRLGADAEAEVLAAAALVRRDSPRARGILAAAHGGARVRATRMDVDTSCTDAVLDIQGYVCLDDGVVQYFPDDGPEPRWKHVVTAKDALYSGQRHILLLERGGATLRSKATGEIVATFRTPNVPSRLSLSPNGQRAGVFFHSQLAIVGPDRIVQNMHLQCPYAVLAATLGDHHVATVCRDLQLAIIDIATGKVRKVDLPLDRSNPAHSMAFDSGDRRLAITGLDGRVMLVDVASGTVGPMFSPPYRPIVRLAFVDNDRLVVRYDNGIVRVVDRTSRRPTLQLPRVAGQRFRVVDGALLTLSKRTRWRWDLPSDRPRTFRGTAGLSSAAFSPNGRWVALAQGNGHLRVIDVENGRLVADVPIAEHVLKQAVFSEDGRTIHVAVAKRPGLAWVDTRDWTIHRGSGVGPLRRIAKLQTEASPRYVGVGYGTSIYLGAPPALEPTPSTRIIDLNVGIDKRVALALGIDGTVYRISAGKDSVALTHVPFARYVAAGPASSFAVALHDRIVVEHATQVRNLTAEAKIDDLVWSDDGRWLVAGGRDGSTRVWSTETGELKARLEGASNRISWVQFAPDGRLATTSWDGVVRMYDLGALDQSPEILERHAQQTWRMSVREALDRPVR